MRGHPHALPGGIVVPSVVRANQAAILNTAAGKPRARMDAKILPRAKAVIIIISVIAVAPPEHKVSSQKSRRPDFSFSRIRRPGDDVPIVR